MRILRRDTVLAEKLAPNSSSVIFVTFRIDTPWMVIAIIAATSAFSRRW